jgi:hypothetical protein
MMSWLKSLDDQVRLTLEEATSANWHLIAELPDAALVVAHFPVAENVSLHLAKGQEPIPDTMMVAGVSLRLGDQTLPLADVLHWYCTASPVAQFTFDNDGVERLPVTLMWSRIIVDEFFIRPTETT